MCSETHDRDVSDSVFNFERPHPTTVALAADDHGVNDLCEGLFSCYYSSPGVGNEFNVFSRYRCCCNSSVGNGGVRALAVLTTTGEKQVMGEETVLSGKIFPRVPR